MVNKQIVLKKSILRQVAQIISKGRNPGATKKGRDILLCLL